MKLKKIKIDKTNVLRQAELAYQIRGSSCEVGTTLYKAKKKNMLSYS
jgi:hypothetical protein